MIKPIVKDMFFLGQKSLPADRSDAGTGQDLLDTLRANSDRCVGMAANMIGVKKCIIVFSTGLVQTLMYNPVILKKSDPYETEEGCLSLEGVRKTKRYRTIEVKWQDRDWRYQRQTFTGWTAQIIQHEIDHLSGIII